MVLPDLSSASPAFKNTPRWNQVSKPTAAKSTLERVSDTRLKYTKDPSCLCLASTHQHSRQEAGRDGNFGWRCLKAEGGACVCLWLLSPPAQPQANLRWGETREELSVRSEMDKIEIQLFLLHFAFSCFSGS